MKKNFTEYHHFLEIIDKTPLVSIDLIIRNNRGEILLGKRVNRPARGFWFVPGGRILKNETIDAAMQRISLSEVGVIISRDNVKLLGTYDHIYEDNFMGINGINTHYVVLAFQTEWDENKIVKPDEQHSETKWWDQKQLVIDNEVHPNTKAYFK